MVDTVHVTRRVHFEQIADVMDIPVAELRALNPQYRRDIIPGDIKPYPLTLPSLQAYAYVANEDSIVNHNASRYARRGVVEPSNGSITTTGSDARGEYVEEETIQWHKVKRGETLSAIANRYGTTVSEIRRLNNCGKRVQRGQRLKIRTVTRRYKEPAPAVVVPETTAPADTLAVAAAQTNDSIAAPGANAPTDSISADRTVTDAFAPQAQNPTAEPARTTEPDATAPQTPARTEQPSRRTNQRARRVTHTVKRGENLTKIARRYGITVAALKRANNISGDEIRVGQRLTIPQ